MQEHATLLGPMRSLVGVITEPPDDLLLPGKVAVLLLNTGLIHHVGPHRLYVQSARALAMSGIVSVRFDLSGIGDSMVRRDNLPIRQLVSREPQEVMDDLARQWGLERFILLGICSGAHGAFKTACTDPRVLGAIMINPLDFAGDSYLAPYILARHYWTRSLFRWQAWSNLFTGRVAYRRLTRVLWHQLTRGIFGHNRQATSIARGIHADIQGLLDRHVALLFILSEDDVSVDHLRVVLGKDLQATTAADVLQVAMIPAADHLFHRLADQQRVLQVITHWTVQQVQKAGLEAVQS